MFSFCCFFLDRHDWKQISKHEWRCKRCNRQPNFYHWFVQGKAKS